MKSIQVAVGLIVVLIYLPMNIYAGWLLYNHVEATQLMWFIWWISLPITIIANIIQAIAKSMDKN